MKVDTQNEAIKFRKSMLVQVAKNKKEVEGIMKTTPKNSQAYQELDKRYAEISEDYDWQEKAIKNKRSPRYMYTLNDFAWGFPKEILMMSSEPTKQIRSKSAADARKLDARMTYSPAISVFSSFVSEQVPLFLWEIEASRYILTRRASQGLEQLGHEQYMRRMYEHMGKTFPEGSVQIKGEEDMTSKFKLEENQPLRKIRLEPLAYEHLGTRKDHNFKTRLVEILKSYANVTLQNPPIGLTIKDVLFYEVELPKMDGNDPSLFILKHDAKANPKTSVYLAACEKEGNRTICVQKDQVDLGFLVDSMKINQGRKIAELKLKSMGITIDKLTQQQEEYLNSWEMGT
jgi:hypothetical protein